MGTGQSALLEYPYIAAREAPSQKQSQSVAQAKTQLAGAVPGYVEVSEIISTYHCTVCHGGSEPRAGLSLDDYKSLMKGSKRGPVIVSGRPGSSEIILRLKGSSEPRMPFTGPPWLSDEEVATIEQWIAAGAKQ